MAYNPSLYAPYMMQQPVNGLISVNGINGAKAYQLPPNSSVALFDENSDIMYIKRTDSAGFPTVSSYRFEEIIPDPAQPSGFASTDQFDKLSERIDEIAKTLQELMKGAGNGEQLVPEVTE